MITSGASLLRLAGARAFRENVLVRVIDDLRKKLQFNEQIDVLTGSEWKNYRHLSFAQSQFSCDAKKQSERAAESSKKPSLRFYFLPTPSPAD